MTVGWQIALWLLSRLLLQFFECAMPGETLRDAGVILAIVMLFLPLNRVCGALGFLVRFPMRRGSADNRRPDRAPTGFESRYAAD